MNVLCLPVLAEASGDQAQHMACQVGDLDPGQDEKTLIVGQKVQTLPALSDALPSDIAVTCCATPGRRSEEQTGQWPAMAIGDKVMHVFTHRLGEA